MFWNLVNNCLFSRFIKRFVNRLDNHHRLNRLVHFVLNRRLNNLVNNRLVPHFVNRFVNRLENHHRLNRLLHFVLNGRLNNLVNNRLVPHFVNRLVPHFINCFLNRLDNHIPSIISLGVALEQTSHHSHWCWQLPKIKILCTLRSYLSLRSQKIEPFFCMSEDSVINSLNVFSQGTCGRGTLVRQYSSRQFLEAPVGRLVHSEGIPYCSKGNSYNGSYNGVYNRRTQRSSKPPIERVSLTVNLTPRRNINLTKRQSNSYNSLYDRLQSLQWQHIKCDRERYDQRCNKRSNSGLRLSSNQTTPTCRPRSNTLYTQSLNQRKRSLFASLMRRLCKSVCRPQTLGPERQINQVT
jgi:hypothetical protein